MKRTSKNPAKTATKRAAKKGSATKKDAADATTPAVAKPPRVPKPEKPRDPRLPAPGTTITRIFNGKTLTLKALADGGFEFDGERFGSVSGAAKKASGAKTVDGFGWWGLNPDAPKARRERDPRCPAIGTTVERVFKGKTLKLKALEDGTFEFDGKVFTSVSGAAKAASGAKTVDGFVWWGLNAAADAKDRKDAKGKKASEPKIGGESNDIATPAGQRAALAAALAGKKKGRPVSKPRGTKGETTAATTSESKGA